MLRALAAGATVAFLGVAGGFLAGKSLHSSATTTTVIRTIMRARSVGFVPVCPRGFYSVDGNYSPLFCEIDSPQALEFYEPVFPHLFALPGTASPYEIQKAIDLDAQHGTLPEDCAAWQLWRHKWRWQAVAFAPVKYCT